MKKTTKLFGFYTHKLKQWFLFWSLLGAGTLILIFLITSTWIGVDVKERCLVAQGKYSGDCVEALIRVVESDENTYRERNYAIWALGQLGDSRARPVLADLYAGNIPEREPYDEGISQYELKKALAQIDEGVNITRIIWARNF